jgi:colanic acid biosynthesis protein WcaH
MSEIPLNLYKQIHASVPIACVDVAIIKDNKILLGRRTNKPAQGQYWLPGGRVLKGETRVEAVHRKIKQETGLEINVLAELGTDETLFPDGPFGGPTHTINTIFLAELAGADTLIADSQNDTLEWFATLPDNLHPYLEKYCQIALEK